MQSERKKFAEEKECNAQEKVPVKKGKVFLIITVDNSLPHRRKPAGKTGQLKWSITLKYLSHFKAHISGIP